MPSYLCSQVQPRLETSMNRTNLCIQHDLFSNVPAPPTLTSLQLRHDELVELLSRLIWEVAGATDSSTKETSDEQDQS